MKIIVLLLMFGLPLCQLHAFKTANLGITLSEKTEDGNFHKRNGLNLQGKFSPMGPAQGAEGSIYQIHSRACGNAREDYPPSLGWVGFTKLESRQVDSSPCMNVFQRAKEAFSRGAVAMIFDVSDSEEDTKALTETEQFVDKPVILIFGNNASVFIRDVIFQGFGTFEDELSTTRQRDEAKYAWVSIQMAPALLNDYQSNADIQKWFYFLAAVIVVIAIVLVVIIIKVRCKKSSRELTVEDMTKRVLAGMKTRVYKTEKSGHHQSLTPRGPPHRSASVLSGLGSTDSGAENCAICLSGYKTGDLVLLSCMEVSHC